MSALGIQLRIMEISTIMECDHFINAEKKNPSLKGSFPTPMGEGFVSSLFSNIDDRTGDRRD